MSIKINYTQKKLSKSSPNLVLFIDEKFNINNLKKYLSKIELSYINDLFKNEDFKKKIFFFDIN